MVVNLEELVRHLFISTFARGVLGQGAPSTQGPLTGHVPSGDEPAEGAPDAETDVILGVTFLAMLFNASYVVSGAACRHGMTGCRRESKGSGDATARARAPL